MPLYSTEAQTKARGKIESGSETFPGPELKKCAEKAEASTWSYLFVHRSKVDSVSKVLAEAHYPVFVKKTIIYRRANKRVKKEERPAVAGLVFVQGESRKIQATLNQVFFSLHLVNDCSTGTTAVIPDSVMQPFMRISEVEPTRIRFMPHAIDYYSEGNPLVRITSGLLAGLEGYRIRISRDKCLVTSLGGLTVAIGGIYKENFENLDEYVRLRREQLKENRHSAGRTLTPLQYEIESGFFTPHDPLDVMAMAESIESWVGEVEEKLKKKNFDEAVEIALFLLEEVGSHFHTAYHDHRVGDLSEVDRLCRETDRKLLAVVESVDVSVDLKEIVETERESLALRYPFLPIDL